MIEIIKGDLLTHDAQYITHQTNCISDGSVAGIAAAIFKKYPYSNTYLNRKQRSVPGTIDVFTEGRHIINMNSQYYPGRFNDAYENDTEVMRKKYFHQCLLKIAKLPDLQSIAFPYLIGCGLGGGNWDHYEQMLNNFAKYVFDKQKTKTFIVRLDQ